MTALHDTNDDVEPVDLDEVVARYHPTPPGVVDDPQLVSEIRARCLYARLPWWIRWRTPTPPDWNYQATGPIH